MRRIVTLIFVLSFYSFSIAQVPTAGLVAYYSFNGNANDAGSSGNNGTVNGATLTTDRFGVSNRAYSFNGVSNISASDNNLPLGNQPRTFSAWVFCGQRQNLINNANPAHLFKYGNSTSTYNYCNTALWGNVLRFSNQSAPPDGDYSYYHPVNEWFHVLIRLSANNRYDYFINGQLAYSNNNEIWNTTSIGSILFGEFLTNGKMDEIRIYNRALCDAEITELYTYEAPPPSINLGSGLVAYYPFDGNTNDVSGNNNHATNIGAAQLVSDRNGESNKAISFDGIDDYLTAPPTTSLNSINYSNNFSFCGWVRSTDHYYIFCKPNGDELHYRFFGNLASITSQVDNEVDQSSIVVEPNKWAFIVCVKNGNEIVFYVNGIRIASQTHYADGYVINTNTPLEIGRDAHGPIEYMNGMLDEIRIYNRALNGAEIEALFNGYNTYSCVNWGGLIPAMDPEAAAALDYLCNKQIIQTNQQPSAVVSSIRKDELAKILFRGLYEPDISASTPVDYQPNPFIDLQPSISAYSREAKALSYLEYDDGISVFKRELSHFRPQFPIQRKYVVKAMLETFNIKPYTPANAPTPDCWYNDVPYNSEMYYYILKARDMGFIKQQVAFSPDSTITRKEAFLILYRMLKYFETTPKPVPALTDYFITSNIDPCNFGRNLGISDANFNAYTKTSFAIAGLMPLSFAHSYNSAYTELPDSSYNIIESLGKGWTHNYNCYLQRVADDLDSNIRYVITWGDGTMNSFKKIDGTYKSECPGVYATLTYNDATNEYTYKTKSQVRYIFKRFVLSNRTIWTLSSVKDRNDNAITLTWTPFPVVAVPSQIRLFKVEDGGGRYLQFSYEPDAPSKIKTVTAVTGGITRAIGFTYQNNYNDLKAYINLKGDSTLYLYEDSLDLRKDHLLKQIKLPKGNIVENTYEQRKLKSTQMAGLYLTNVNTQFNYTPGNNTNFVESDISTTRSGNVLNSNIKHDQLGNVKNATSPTGNLTLAYNDTVHATKPTFFSNSINNLSATTRYDTMGNVTSVNKTGAGFNLKDSFTYNGFNDILTYINARGYRTTFDYNTTGNLTKITDALLNETTMQVNANGTVSKVTNPENIYTDFLYDAFGNTTQSKLMNAITSTALYDDASRLIQKTDPNGVITTIGYDVNDMVLQVIADPAGLNNTVRYHYDKNDNLDTIANPKGGKTSLKYNEYDQLVEYRFGGFTKAYAYNEDGTLQTFTNQNGQTFTNFYNANGTLQTDGYANYGYDAEFNLQSITSTVNNKTIQFGYDALKRTNSISYNDYPGNTVQYEYDNNSNVTAITYPGGFKVGYAYDELDRLKQVYNFTTGTNYAQYTYYKDGRLKDQLNGNGTQTVYRYDVLGRLDSIGNFTSTNANIASYKFAMDNVGNHTGETHYEPALPVLPVLQAGSFAYEHDETNRMNKRAATNFTYDNNGNNTTAAGDWNTAYTFDSKDNLLTSTAPLLNCEYDGLENRRRKNDTLYVLDILGGSNVLMETDANGVPLAYYIHGLGLVCRLDATQANPAYYHYDYRGSTTAITNNSQTVTHSYRYGAFGELLQSSETGFKNPYRYVGKYGVQYEGDSLYFMRARYYNAVKGRFLGEDPVWGVNLYGYASNNPLMNFDYVGELSKEIKKDFTENYYSIIDTKLEFYSNPVGGFGKKTGMEIVEGLSKIKNWLSNQATADDDVLAFDLTSYIDNFYNSTTSLFKDYYNRDGSPIDKNSDGVIQREEKITLTDEQFKLFAALINHESRLKEIQKDCWPNKISRMNKRKNKAIKSILDFITKNGLQTNHGYEQEQIDFIRAMTTF